MFSQYSQFIRLTLFMKTKSIIQRLLICVFAMTFTVTASNATEAEIPSLNYSPGFTVLRTPDGTMHMLQEYTNKGKWLVVMFWAYDCSACNAEAESYNELHNRRKDTDLELLGISLDGWKNKDESDQFIKRHKLNFPNLIGESEQVNAMFARLSGKNLVGVPGIFIYGPKGELKAAEIGAVPVSLIEKYVAGNF